MYMTIVPNDMMNVIVHGEGSEETKVPSTLETDEEALGVEPSQEECEELAWVED